MTNVVDHKSVENESTVKGPRVITIMNQMILRKRMRHLKRVLVEVVEEERGRVGSENEKKRNRRNQ